MVKDQKLREALQNIGNIAGAPVPSYMLPELNLDVLLCRLEKISEIVGAALCVVEHVCEHSHPDKGVVEQKEENNA